MNTEKIEKLKKSLSNSKIPADLKPKIEAEIKRLEDLDAKQSEPKEEEKEVKPVVKKTTTRKPRTTKPVAKKTSTAKPSQTSKPKRTAMSVAKEIRKEGESWKDAMSRASKVMKEKSHTATKDVESELEKLTKLVRSKKELKGQVGRTNLLIDAKRKAKPMGRRVSKDGNVYYENRANRTDRGTYGKYHLAEGGYLTDPNFGNFQNTMFADGGGIPNNYEGKTPEEVWNMWTEKQKQHFLVDHFNHFIVEEFKGKNLIDISRLEYKKLPLRVRLELDFHVNKGQYAKGGNINENTTKMRKQKLKNGDTVTIYGKRWFDRVNGNTYHTAEVEVNGTTLGKSPMTYGYDDQYLETGKEILLQHYDLPRGMTERSPMWQLRDNGVTLTKYVTDGLKRDLAKGGGVRKVGNREYPTGRNWTNDHRHIDKSDDLEVNYKRKKKFELGGNVVTDLAGHTGGKLGTGDPSMLSGFSNTSYTGLVGETGAMSSGEMFMNGGGVGSYKILNELYELKSDGVKKVQLNGFFESIGYVIDLKLDDSQIKKIDLGEYQTTYANGGGLPSGASQSYMITESLGNPAQHFAKGGGVRTKNGQTYNYGRVWTNDHNEFDKGSDHEVEYRRKKSSFFAKGGAMENFDYDDVLQVLKEKLEDSIDELPSEYEYANDFKGEEVEKQSRDGFIAFTDGGYEVTWFESMSMFSGSGNSLPTKPLDDEMQRQIAYNYQLAKETFIENYPDIAEELGEDNIDYNSLYEAGYESEAEELSEMEMNYDGDDTIMCEIGAYYYDTENYRGVDEKHTIRLYGLVNLESPYHRRGNLDDSYDIDITFDSISELKEKVDAGLKEIIDWFDGKYYNDSDAEMKIRRMADGGAFAPNVSNGTEFMSGVYADGGFMDGVYAGGGNIAIDNLNKDTDLREKMIDYIVSVKAYEKRMSNRQYDALEKRISDKSFVQLKKEYDTLKGNSSFANGGAMATGGGVGNVPKNIQERLEYLRGEIRNESISYGEIAELQSMKEYIDPSDVELLQWAGVSEFEEDDNYAKGGMMAKGGKVSPFKNIMETNTITEKEINLIKMKMNNDKVDEATQEVIDYIWENSPQLTPDQNKKGIDYLRNLWKSPTGKERTNNPFGYREQDTLETFEYFELRGFYDAGNRYRKFYVPLYTCVGADSNFEYAFYNGEVNILG